MKVHLFPTKITIKIKFPFLYEHLFFAYKTYVWIKTVYSILLLLPSMWKSWTALADAAQELKSEHSAVTVWWMKMYVTGVGMNVSQLPLNWQAWRPILPCCKLVRHYKKFELENEKKILSLWIKDKLLNKSRNLHLSKRKNRPTSWTMEKQDESQEEQ